METQIKNAHGFTLIEMLVAGTLSVVVVIGLVTFLYMYNRAAKEGTANSLMQQQTEVVLEQLSRDIWTAVQVVGPAENWSSTPSNADLQAMEIHLFNPDHLIFAAYKFEGGLLKEAHPNPAVPALTGAEFQPFTIGSNNQVKVCPNSAFQLAALRKAATVNISLSMIVNKVNYTSPLRWEKIGCRNGG